MRKGILAILLIFLLPQVLLANHVDYVITRKINGNTVYEIHYTDGSVVTTSSYDEGAAFHTNDPSAGVPVDGGIGLLLAAGIGYASRKLIQKRNPNDQ